MVPPPAVIRCVREREFLSSHQSLLSDDKLFVQIEAAGRILSRTQRVEAEGFFEVDAHTVDPFSDAQARAFGTAAALTKPQTEGTGPSATRYGVAQDGRLVSGLETLHYRTVWGGKTIPMEILGGVFSPLEARRKGHNRDLLRGVLDRMRQRGTPIASITTPFSYPFYRGAGWEYAFKRVRYSLSPNVLLQLPKREGSARHYEYSAPLGVVPLELDILYALALRPNFQGFALRNPAQWAARLSGKRTDAYIWDGPNGPSGYAIIAINHEDVTIRELVATDDDGLLGLLRMIGSLDSQTTKITWDALPIYQLDRWVGEPERVKAECTPEGMFRVVDIKQAMEHRQFPEGGSSAIAIHLHDDLCDWNAGLWSLNFDGARGGAEPLSGPPPDDTGFLDIQTFSALYSGAITAHEAMRYYGAQLSHEQAELLDDKFRGHRPLLLEWF